MRAVILAAGIGDRLGRNMPKILLEVGGQTLLARHLALLRMAGIDDVVLGVGYQAEAIKAELSRLGRADVELVFNPDYREGSVVTLFSMRDALCAGGDVLLMDGDVLYDGRMLARLIGSHHACAFLLDRDVAPGEEPMKLAIKDDQPVDFRKTLSRAHDYYGESVGFFRLNRSMAEAVVDAAKRIITEGRRGDYMEEALRLALIEAPAGAFGVEDVTGIPWVEIDFPEDIARAENEILPALRTISIR